MGLEIVDVGLELVELIVRSLDLILLGGCGLFSQEPERLFSEDICLLRRLRRRRTLGRDVQRSDLLVSLQRDAGGQHNRVSLVAEPLGGTLGNLARLHEEGDGGQRGGRGALLSRRSWCVAV